MPKSSDPERATRLNVALALMEESENLSQAATALVRKYGISKRQAYRYLGEARARDGPVPIPDRKVAFTVKLSLGFDRSAAQAREASGKTLKRTRGRGFGRFSPQGSETWLTVSPKGER